MVSNRQRRLVWRARRGSLHRIHGCMNGQAWRGDQASDHATIAVGPGKTAEAREWQGWQSPLVGVSLVIKVKVRGGGAGRSERKEDEYL